MTLHAILLAVALLALLSGPALYGLAQRRPSLLAFLDGFVLVSISGLVLVEILPEVLGTGGLWALAFVAVGLVGPSLLEHSLVRARREAHLLALGLALVGLVLHSVGDGAGLSAHDLHGDEHGTPALGIAIAIHRIPVGLMIWWLLYPVFGALWPALVLLAMCVATYAGYHFGFELGALLGGRGWAWLQALISGSILHVVFGRPHLDERSAHLHHQAPYEGLGNIAALLMLVWLGSVHPPEPGVVLWLDRWIDLALRWAPFLLLAHVASLLLPVAHVPDTTAPAGGRDGLLGPLRGFWQSPLGGEDGLSAIRSRPGSALPVLVQARAGGFLTLLLSLPLLGPWFTLWRMAASVALTALTCLMAPSFRPVGGQAGASKPPAAAPHRLQAAAARIDATAPWILSGVSLGALLAAEPALLATHWLTSWPGVVTCALLAAPLYLCAAGLTPVAAVLAVTVATPGAALALLLCGPVLSLPTLRASATAWGKPAAVTYAGCVLLGSIGIGLLCNRYAPVPMPDLSASATPRDTLRVLSLCAVALVYAWSLTRRGGRSWFRELSRPQGLMPHGHAHAH